MSDKKFKESNRDQMYLLPPSLKDWLSEDHLAYFIIELVDHLDLSAVYASYGGEGRGQPPYDPAMMTSLLFYAYCVGTPSSRKIERCCVEDVAFRVIAANQRPDHDSICEFRKRHLSALARLFLDVLKLCQEAGLVKLGHVALDGSKVKANASKHKAMSYGRMKEKEDELERQEREMLELADRVDAEEEAKFGKGVRGDELPQELRRRESRLKKIREAKEKPDSQSQRNFTDPDSRIMKDGATKSFEQCYNAQAGVDGTAQVIVAAEVTQAANDKEQLVPMVLAVEANTGSVPEVVTADAGYYSESNVKAREGKKIDGYIAVDRIKHGEAPAPAEGEAGPELSVKELMRRKLLSERGRSVYAKRKAVVEPVFGQIKQVRGLRRFSLRGLGNVSAEWQIWCLTHNVLKLFRSGWRPASVLA